MRLSLCLPLVALATLLWASCAVVSVGSLPVGESFLTRDVCFD